MPTLLDGDQLGVGIVRGEPADQREAVFVGVNAGRIRAGQADVEFGDGVAAPTQGEGGRASARSRAMTTSSSRARSVARRGRAGVPHPSEIGGEGAEALLVV